MFFEIHDIILHRLWKRAMRIHRKVMDNPRSTFADIFRSAVRVICARAHYLSHQPQNVKAENAQ